MERCEGDFCLICVLQLTIVQSNSCAVAEGVLDKRSVCIKGYIFPAVM